MNNDKTTKLAWAIVALTLALVLFSAIAGCSRKALPVIHDTCFIAKTEYIDRATIDTIKVEVLRDRYVKGDSVFITRDSIVYRYKFLHDSIHDTDTIYISKETPVAVANRGDVGWWRWLLVGALIGGLFALIWRCRK